jgi:DUF2933 family protein
MTEHAPEDHRRGGNGRWVFWGFAAVAAFFLITEHRAHVFEFLPFVLLAACPVMHLLHGHGGHGAHDDAKEKKP